MRTLVADRLGAFASRLWTQHALGALCSVVWAARMLGGNVRLAF